MRELPTGTVTFLFTDIEGSTRLLQLLGDRYPIVLEDHARLVRDGIAGGGGVEVSTEGDSFFAVFASAPRAVEAAASIQQALASHEWLDGATVGVRMGLHTGDGVLGGDNYIGIDVHRAARIAGAGHGGQVLLSHATRSLSEQVLRDGIGLRHLGEHRLKDLADPEDLYELLIDGLPQLFPPIRSLDPVLHNLPIQLTSFLGRQREIDEIRTVLSDARLVTLTGTGGTGKTRLAIEAASLVAGSTPDGAWYVPLASIADPSLLATTIVETLGIRFTAGSARGQLVQHFEPRDALLVLDNFEQILSAGPAVSVLLADCPKLRILITSRAALHVSGEREVPIPTLPVPPSDPADRRHDTATDYPAVELFVERARAARPDFVLGDDAPTVAEIVARLDGLPLAIELAAALVKLLPPRAILERLGRRLDVLTGGPQDRPERQRSLRGAIAWSYEILDPRSRMLLEHLAVFVGGASYEMAEEVCAPDDPSMLLEALRTLVDHSLVVQSQADGEPRFSLLGSIRDFALERLEESGKAAEVRGRHSAAFYRLARDADMGVRGPDERRWATIVGREFDNLRAVVARGIGEVELDVVLGIPVALTRYAMFRLRFEVNEWAEAGIGLPGAEEHRLFAPACGTAAWGAVLAGDLDRAKLLAERGLAKVSDPHDKARQYPLEVLGDAAMFEGRLDDALVYMEELGGLLSDGWDRAHFNLGLSLVATYSGDIDAGLQAAHGYRREAERLGTPTLRAWASYAEGEALMQRDPVRARALFEDAIALADSVGSRFLTGVAQVSAASLDARHGHPWESLQPYRELVDQWRRAEHWTQLWITLRSVAELLVRLGSLEVAAVLLGAMIEGGSAVVAFGDDEQLLARLNDMIEEGLGAEELAAARARGGSMSADEVATTALAEIDRLLARGEETLS